MIFILCLGVYGVYYSISVVTFGSERLFIFWGSLKGGVFLLCCLQLALPRMETNYSDVSVEKGFSENLVGHQGDCDVKRVHRRPRGGRGAFLRPKGFMVFNREMLSMLSSRVPVGIACQIFGFCATTLKRYARMVGIPRWEFRVMGNGGDAPDDFTDEEIQCVLDIAKRDGDHELYTCCCWMIRCFNAYKKGVEESGMAGGVVAIEREWFSQKGIRRDSRLSHAEKAVARCGQRMGWGSVLQMLRFGEGRAAVVPGAQSAVVARAQATVPKHVNHVHDLDMGSFSSVGASFFMYSAMFCDF